MDGQLNLLMELGKKIAQEPYDWVAMVPRLTKALPWKDEMRASGKFYCLLDEQPGELVPERFKRAALAAATDAQAQALIINPYCWFSDEGMPPAVLANLLPTLEGYLIECYTVWVGDPATNQYVPFALGPEYAELLQNIRTGKLRIQDLSVDVRANLLLAKIIIKPDFYVERQKELSKEMALAHTQLKEGKYALLPDLVPPLFLGALREYYRTLVQNEHHNMKDSRTPGRYGRHREIIASFLHYQLFSTVCYVVGTAVKPSYSYFGAYQGGSILTPHTDRQQCEYTVSLCIDYTPEPEKETPWPIYVEASAGTAEVFQSLGDGLLFMGRELTHYRHQLEESSSSTSIFFHYVNMDFQGSLD